MKIDEIKVFVEAFENILTRVYLPQNREIQTEMKRLEKGQVAIRGKVTYPNFSMTADIVCQRDKKNRDEYQQTLIRYAFTCDGKTVTKTEEVRETMRETFAVLIGNLMQKSEYTLKLKEEN